MEKRIDRRLPYHIRACLGRSRDTSIVALPEQDILNQAAHSSRVIYKAAFGFAITVSLLFLIWAWANVETGRASGLDSLTTVSCSCCPDDSNSLTQVHQ